ncbi:hypothetical protein ACIQAD_16075 [Streptomyces sp. NPDC088551]|uniref:hypothetical protein n=1 Tax=Streptomyces sp. NPDC088551 TaxID=3365863 RepID=UPI0038289C3C
MSVNRYETAVTRYFDAWNATSADERAEAVALAWAEDGRIVSVRGFLDRIPASA